MRTHKNSSSNPDGQPKSSRASSLDLNDDERRALAGDFVKLVDDAIQAHANLEVDLPPGPPFYLFESPDEFRNGDATRRPTRHRYFPRAR